MMNISKPVLRDIPELLRLWKGQYDYHCEVDDVYYVAFSEELESKFEKYLTKAINDDDPHVLVARDDEKILGFITFTEDKDSYFDTKITDFGLVMELYVSEEARSRGVGKALMRESENFFVAKGLKDVKLFCSSLNVDALDFYRHLGYTNRHTVFFKKI